MYSRVLRSFLAINVHNLSKCMNVTQSSDVASRIHPLFTGQSCKPNLTNFRLCSSMSPQNKDTLAEEDLAEFVKHPENEKQYKILQLEIDVMRQSGGDVPNEIKPRHWMELIRLGTHMKRRKYLRYIFELEKKKENLARKKQVRMQEHLNKQHADSELPNHLQYKLGGNAMFLRLYDGEMNQFYNWRLMQAIMFGQKLVLDCGYEDKMNRMETKYCARQLQLAFATNRASKDPFDLHYCNFDKKGYLHQEFHSYIPTMYQPHFPMNVSEASYLDLFDKDKLVYLTPDSNQELTTFDHEAIYIIGAIVDKVSGMPLSIAKAKREGLRTAKLPIDRYLDFGGGSGKSLTLNQMVDILADIKRTGDWSQALRHVPRRKLYAYRQHAEQKKMEKVLRNNQQAYVESSSPQNYSLQARNKFRTR